MKVNTNFARRHPMTDWNRKYFLPQVELFNPAVKETLSDPRLIRLLAQYWVLVVDVQFEESHGDFTAEGSFVSPLTQEWHDVVQHASTPEEALEKMLSYAANLPNLAR